MNNLQTININELLERVLQNDITKLIHSLKITTLQEGESSTHFCIINKSDTNSMLDAFSILLTRLLAYFEGWDDYYSTQDSPVFIDKQYLHRIIGDYFYIKNNVIQLNSLPTEITLEQFAITLYSPCDEKNLLKFTKDMLDKFPLISLYKIIDHPDNFMEDLEYFMETKHQYIYLTSYCSG